MIKVKTTLFIVECPRIFVNLSILQSQDGLQTSDTNRETTFSSHLQSLVLVMLGFGTNVSIV